jgi:hypothetical protein
MLERIHDVNIINTVANDPSIRPFIGVGPDILDFTDSVERPENIWLMGRYGGFCMTWSAPSIYEIHTFILTEGRGVWAREAARAMINYGASAGAKMLWTRISETQPNVIAYAVEMGMAPCGIEIDTLGQPYGVYSMDVVCL